MKIEMISLGITKYEEKEVDNANNTVNVIIMKNTLTKPKKKSQQMGVQKETMGNRVLEAEKG